MFDRVFAALAAEAGPHDRLMMGNTHLKAHRTAAGLLKKGIFPAVSTAPRGLELQAPRRLLRPGPPHPDAADRGQASDYSGAALMLLHLRPAREHIGDRGYDSGRFRLALQNKGISPCTPSTHSRKVPIRMTQCSTGSATASKTCSAGSKTGDALRCALTAVPTPSSAPSP